MPAPPSFRVVTAPSAVALLDHLDAEARRAPLSPFDDEVIVVQSLGMERWVRQQLATRRGAAASLRMPFPAAFCRDIALALPGHAGGLDPRFDEQALTWRLTALLDDAERLAAPVYAPLATYLQGADAAKRYALARRIAGRFDEYRLYRDDLLLAWERGAQPVVAGGLIEPLAAQESDAPRLTVSAATAAHADWQAELWRALVADVGGTPRHFARWFTESLAYLETVSVAPPSLPPRVAVFGVSTLPPLFVRLLAALARFVPVTAYLLTPSAAGARERAPRERTPRHPLEERFGHTSRQLLHALGQRATAVECLDVPLPAGNALLARVQRALRSGTATDLREEIAAEDRSLLVHECHSPVRELEVLRDQLLDAFAADPTLRPHDVLVMVPDVERYAPLAAVVFGDPHAPPSDERPVIPYRIADRAPARDASAARALAMLLELAGSRFLASEVLDLLAIAPVQRAAGITAAQFDLVVRWVQEAGIRWGRDGVDRAAIGLPSLEDYTWRQGLDRLLAGYAAGRVDALVEGVVPVSGDTIGDAELLGAFVEWVEALVARVEALRAPRPLLAWSLALQDTLAWLVAPDTLDERRAAERVQRELVELARTAGDQLGDVGTRPVPFDVARRWLAGALADDRRDTGFLSGRLTLCAMKPMRAIPFRVIAMLGLDDRAFPRRERRAAFDLIEAVPRAGDRDAKADDRQLFLDTLLCAGDRLHLSWVGRSQQNNAEIAPSVVLAELLDLLDADAALEAPAGEPVHTRVREHVLVSHALQPFNPVYFTGRDPRRFSFDRTWARSVAAARTRRDAPPFFGSAHASASRSASQSASSAAPLVVTLGDLMECWANPARFHATRVLQLTLASAADAIEDLEPVTVGALDRYRLHEGMLQRHLRGDTDPERESRLALAGGLLPPGALGPAWYAGLREQFTQFAGALGTPAFGSPLAVEVDGPSWTLIGRLDGQLADGQLRVRAAKVRDRDRVQGFIAHLAYAAMGGTGITWVKGMDGEVHFAPYTQPTAITLLDALIGGVRRALAAPLPYFPEAGAAYWKASADPDRARAKARAGYEAVVDFTTCDLADPYVALLWRGRDPLTECWDEFVALCTTLWAPLTEAQR